MASDHCLDDPNFATICSFIEKFGEICHVGVIPFSDLQEMLENTTEVPLPLVQLHIRLLRRVFKSINTQKWEKSVSKFAHMFNSQDGWEIERFGYKKSKIQTKLRILKNLLESQFDYNNKFKGEVNKLPASDLRLVPLGRDAKGHSYWYQVDSEANLRVYREDVDEEVWEIVAQSREEMDQLISQLKSGEIRKTKVAMEEDAIPDDDVNGLESLELEPKDILLDTGKVEEEKENRNDDEEEEDELSDDDLSESLVLFEGDDIIDSPLEDEPPEDKKESAVFPEISKSIANTNTSGKISPDIISSAEISSKKSTTPESSDVKITKPPSISATTATVKDEIITESESVLLENIKNYTVSTTAPPTAKISGKATVKGDYPDKDFIDSAMNLNVNNLNTENKNIKTEENSKSVTLPQDVLNIRGDQLNSSSSPNASSLEQPVTLLKTDSTLSLEINHKSLEKVQEEYKSSLESKTEMQPITPLSLSTNKTNPSDNFNVNVQSVNIFQTDDKNSDLPIILKDEDITQNDEIPMEIDDDDDFEQNIKLEDEILHMKATMNVTESPYFQSIQEQQQQHPEKQSSYDSPYFIHNKQHFEGISTCQNQPANIPPVSTSVIETPSAVISSQIKKIESEIIDTIHEPKSNSARIDDNNIKDLTPIHGIKAGDSVQDEFISSESTTIVTENLPPSETILKQGTVKISNNTAEIINEGTKKGTEGETSNNESDLIDEHSLAAQVSLALEMETSAAAAATTTPTTTTSFPILDDNRLQFDESQPLIQQQYSSPFQMDFSTQKLTSSSTSSSSSTNVSSEVRENKNPGSQIMPHTMTDTPYAFNIDSMLSRLDKVPARHDEQLSLNVRVTERSNTHNFSTQSFEKTSTTTTHAILEHENIQNVSSYYQPAGGNEYSSFYDSPTTTTPASQQQQSPLVLSAAGNEGAVITETVGKITTEVVSSTSKIDCSPKEFQQLESSLADIPNKTSDSSIKENPSKMNEGITVAVLDKKDEAKDAFTTSPDSRTFTNQITPTQTTTTTIDSTDTATIKAPTTSSEVPPPPLLNVSSTSSSNISEPKTQLKNEDKVLTIESPLVEESKSTVTDESIGMDKHAEEKTEQTDTTRPEIRHEIIKPNTESTVLQSSEDKQPKENVVDLPVTSESNMKSNDSDNEKQENQQILAKEPAITEKAKDEEMEKEITDYSKSTTLKESQFVQNDSNVPDGGISLHAIPSTNNETIGESVRIPSNDVKNDTEKSIIAQKPLEKNNEQAPILKTPLTDVISLGQGKESISTTNKIEEIKATAIHASSHDGCEDKNKSGITCGQNNTNIGNATDKSSNKDKIQEVPIVEAKKPPANSLVGYDYSSSDNDDVEEDGKDKSEGNKNIINKQVSESLALSPEKDPRPIMSSSSSSGGGCSQKRKLEDDTNDAILKDEFCQKEAKAPKISSPSSAVENPIVGETIEEAVFIVTGVGEGALNEGGNNNDDNPSETSLPSTEANIQNISSSQLNSSVTSIEGEGELNNISDTAPPVKHKGRGRPRKNPPKEVLKVNNKNVQSTPPPPAPSEGARNNSSSSASNSRRNSFNDDLNGSSGGNVRRSGRVAQIRQKEEEERRKLEEERLAQLKEAQIKKKQKQLERELKAGKQQVPKPPKPPKTPKVKAPKAFKPPKVAKAKGATAAKQASTYIPPSESDDDDTDSGDEEEVDESYDGRSKTGKKGRKKRAKNGKGRPKGAAPWSYSSSEDEAVEEEEHLEEEEEEEELVFNNSDHEFSPESDIEDDEFSPSRHARTAKQKEEAVDKYAETFCDKCGKGDHPEWILLCDSCDKGWHASCVIPQLWVIPEGEWFCPPCEHNLLVDKLSENLIELDKLLKKRENENLRKKRLEYVGISLNNVLPENKEENGEEEEKQGKRKSRHRRIYSDEEEHFINDGDDDGSRSGSGSGSGSYESEEEPMYQLRARRATKGFSFKEYDDMINTALRDDSLDEQEQEDKTNGHQSSKNNGDLERLHEEEYGIVKGKGKSISNGESSEEEEEEVGKKRVKFSDRVQKKTIKDSDDTDDDELDEQEKNRRKILNQSQRKNKRRLNDLDATSEEDSDEDFKGSDGEDDEDAEDVVEDESEWSGDDESDDSIAMAKLAGRKRKHREHRRPLGRQERYSDAGTVRRSTRRRKSRVIYDESDQEEDEEDQTEKWQSGESEEEEEEEISEESDSDSDDWGKKKKQKKPIASGKSKLAELFLGASPNKVAQKPKKKKRRKPDEDDVDRAWTNKFGSKKKLAEEPVERKTRGRQINFKDILDSGESDDDGNIRPKRRRILSDSDEDSEEPSSSRKLAEEIKQANIRAEKEEKLQHELKMKELADAKKKLEKENNQALNKIPEDSPTIPPPVPPTIPNIESVVKDIPIKITHTIVESIMGKSPISMELSASSPQHQPPVLNEEIPPVGQNNVPRPPIISNSLPPPPISMPPILQQTPPAPYLPTVIGSARVGKKKTNQQQNSSGGTDVLPFPSSSKSKSSSNSNSSPSKSLAAALSTSVTSSSSPISRSILPPNIPPELSRLAAPMYANQSNNPALRPPFHPSAWGRTPPPYHGPNLGKPPPLHPNSSSFMAQQLRPPFHNSQSPPPPPLRIPNPNTLQAFQQFTKRSSGDLGGPLYRMPSHQLPPSVLPSMRERERIFLGGTSPYSPYGMLPPQVQGQQHPALFAPPFDYRAAESFKEEMLERQSHHQSVHHPPTTGTPTTVSTTSTISHSAKDDGNHGEFGGLVSYFSSQHEDED